MRARPAAGRPERRLDAAFAGVLVVAEEELRAAGLDGGPVERVVRPVRDHEVGGLAEAGDLLPVADR